MRSKVVSTFLKGFINSVEAQSIPDGASSASLNWKHNGDRIELRKGYKVLGTEQSGTGKVTGLHTTFKADATQILYRKRGRKLEYYNTATSDWTEVSTNLFPTAASSEDVLFSDYASLAGNQMWFGSPNSSLYKILAANPGSYADQYLSSKNFKGYLKIKQNRMFLWNRKAGATEQSDKTGVYGSYIDTAGYTTVTAETRHNGDGSTVTFANTLAFKAGGARRTCFAVSLTDGTETFTDDYNGVLTGSLGGTGTINYMTGAYSITFNTAPIVGVNNITATYLYEDATSSGIADFTKSATRTAGQGFVFRQDDGGGDVQNIQSYGDVEYCFHRLKTWALTLTQTDTSATNLIYRDHVGIPNERAAVGTGDGIYYVDDFDQTKPAFRLMTLNNISTQVIPLPVSDELNLENYRFDKAAAIEYGDLVLFACRHKDATENNIIFAYNKRLKLWDVYDYYVSCFAIYNGALICGDSVTENVYELFSGFDDNGSVIYNYWESNLSKLDIEGLKKSKKLWVQGELSRDQTLNIYLSVDRGPYVLVGTQNGTDSNVDATARTIIGSDAIGEATLGGQTSTSVYNYIKEIRLNQGKWFDIKIKFQATEIGYCSVSTYTFHDILTYTQKLPIKYRSN